MKTPDQNQTAEHTTPTTANSEEVVGDKPTGETPTGEAAGTPSTGKKPTGKEETMPIRLWLSAYHALKTLKGKYRTNMTGMASIAIIAYAKKSAAVQIVKFRVLEDKILFALQASATDIRTGLSNLREDLYQARKSNRDPVALKAAYDAISAKYQATMHHADETLSLMDKECLLTDLLTGDDHEILMEMIKDLEIEKPTTQLEQKKRDLQLKILKALLP